MGVSIDFVSNVWLMKLKLHAISRLTDLLIKVKEKTTSSESAHMKHMKQVQTKAVKNEQMLNGRLTGT